ncbi:molybdopterin dinucleotide binding domain-containing protein [Mycobacterium sp. GA-2829]|uniref:molybdopterin dinucleotide binding domain-containing protein n=1 Tax=Mycobacterium sp. GA-2829 TaxID=1772283 RepID=UPI0012FB30D7|nr:molybdopterin dinucleotide binding domain-containing protein [Mycobacterium sp. GA-2829]
MDDRILLMPDGVADEIDTLLNSTVGVEGQFGEDGQFTHLMICRRTGQVYNSMCHELPKTATGNPAYLHPKDLEGLDAQPGQVMRLVSAHGAIDVELASDPSLRRGVVSISHGFGSAAGGERNSGFGSVADLLSTEATLDRVVRMPRMSAVPVRFEVI